ncbi:MAG: hypothetical protein IH623_01875 [Verrucomicrobia bacterium]|nr:hypothetical protein [Verrucomicrobiota bacterium]
MSKPNHGRGWNALLGMATSPEEPITPPMPTPPTKPSGASPQIESFANPKPAPIESDKKVQTPKPQLGRGVAAIMADALPSKPTTAPQTVRAPATEHADAIRSAAAPAKSNRRKQIPTDMLIVRFLEVALLLLEEQRSLEAELRRIDETLHFVRTISVPVHKDFVGETRRQA